MERRTSGASPYEELYGFSQAVRVGDRILVSGTAPVEEDGSSTSGDAAAQARRCFAIILKAVEELGGSAADVVRTRMFIIDPADADQVGTCRSIPSAATPFSRKVSKGMLRCSRKRPISSNASSISAWPAKDSKPLPCTAVGYGYVANARFNRSGSDTPDAS